ncbi:hypothetical protein HQ585_09910 [candidate division KSB1 bacterium]|nr:hypothetical protein [candidate division KSB1 bacterium]
MKKLQSSSMIILIVFVSFFLLLSETSNAQFADSLALIVVADAVYPNDAETQVVYRLEDMEFEVQLIGESDVNDAIAGLQSLVFISATVSSGTAAASMPGLADLPVPVINCEPFLYDHQGFQELDGSEFSSTEIMIVLEGHPLAAGLSEDVFQVTNSEKAFSYGTPVGDVDIIATSVDADTQVVLFGYDTGAAMFAGTAPARRVGTFLLNDVADDMTEDGWALFDASVIWAMGADEPNAVDDPLQDVNTFALHENYPNPFNPTTSISFSVCGTNPCAFECLERYG